MTNITLTVEEHRMLLDAELDYGNPGNPQTKH